MHENTKQLFRFKWFFYVVDIVLEVPLMLRHIYARVEYIMFRGAIIRIAGLFNYFIRRGIRLRTIDNIVCLLTEYLYRVSVIP